jgi:hypothetical protein
MQPFENMLKMVAFQAQPIQDMISLVACQSQPLEDKFDWLMIRSANSRYDLLGQLSRAAT